MNPLQALQTWRHRRKLIRAIALGDQEMAASMLRQGCSPQFQARNGKPPLILAFEANQPSIFRLLGLHGARWDPAASGNELFQQICSNPDPAWSRLVLRLVDFETTSPKVLMELVVIALTKHRLALGLSLLWRLQLKHAESDWRPHASQIGLIPLPFGRLRHRRLIRAMVHLDLQDLLTTQYGESILHVVLRAGLVDLVPRFAQDPGRCLSRGNGGTLPLLLSAKLGFTTLFPTLQVTQAVTGAVTNGELHSAIAHPFQSEELAKKCLLAGADPNGIHDRVRALNRALSLGNEPVAELLLCFGARPDALDRQRFPPLARSAQMGAIGLTRLLLWLGCNPNDHGGHYVPSYPFMCLSSKREGVALLRILVEAGFDVNSRTSSMETALTNAAARDDIELIEALVSHGADINGCSASGFTPLHWAALGNKRAAASRLISLGADPHLKDKSGETALNIAARSQFHDLAMDLRKSGLRDQYSPAPEWRSQIRELEYDFFISYRQYRFSEIAVSLAETLRNRGCSVFLDYDSPELSKYLGGVSSNRIPDAVLKKVIFIAAQSSHCTLFFESTLEMEVDPATGKSKTAFSWQLYEKLYSNKFLMLYGPSTPDMIDTLVNLAAEAQILRQKKEAESAPKELALKT